MTEMTWQNALLVVGKCAESIALCLLSLMGLASIQQEDSMENTIQILEEANKIFADMFGIDEAEDGIEI